MVNKIKEILDSAKRIAIIEPHYDDAWLNLGGFILKNPDKEFTIISVCSDSFNKLNETKNLEGFVPNLKTKKLNYKGIHYNLREKLKKHEYRGYFCKLNRLKDFKEFESHLKEEIKDFDLVLLPCGFKGNNSHPQHILASQLKSKNKTFFYMEFPYFYEKSDNIDKIKFIQVYKLNIEDKINEKINIFKKVYKSQSGIADIKTEFGDLNNINEEVIIKK